jgi:hypothetical protein
MPNNRIDDLLNMGSESEARMLDLESDPNWAQKVHTNIVGGEWDKYRDVVEDVVGSIAEPAPIDWILDFMDSYEDLKGETEATAEGMLERVFGEDIPPEAMEIISGIVDPGRKLKALMSFLKKFFKGGKGAPQTSKLVIQQSTKPVPKDIAQRELDKTRRLLEETPTPHPIRIPRKFHKKRYEDIDPTEKPPLKLKGGGHLYKKGYYGKSYR